MATSKYIDVIIDFATNAVRVINDLWNRKSSRAAREKTIVDKAQRKKRIRGHPRLTEVGPLDSHSRNVFAKQSAILASLAVASLA